MIRLSDSRREQIITDLMPDLTPLLDVMFMLIVFLILTANSVAFTFDIALPKDTEKVATALQESEVIKVQLLPGASQEDMGWKIGERSFPDKEAFQQALLALHTQQPDRKVIILGEPDTPMQRLLSVLTFLRKHAIPTADIVMEQE